MTPLSHSTESAPPMSPRLKQHLQCVTRLHRALAWVLGLCGHLRDTAGLQVTCRRPPHQPSAPAVSTLYDFGQALSHRWLQAQADMCSLRVPSHVYFSSGFSSCAQAWLSLHSECALEPHTHSPASALTHSLGLGCSSTSVCLRIRSVQFLVLSARARRFSK